MELERTGAIKWREGDFCVAFDRPVSSYKTREEMHDSIYGYAVIDSYPVAGDEKQVIVSFIELIKDKQLKTTKHETTIEHLIPTYADETDEEAINRYWDELESQQK